MRVILGRLSIALLLTCSSCADARDERVLLYAAASLADAAGELVAAWAEAGGGEAVAVLAGSSTLARQIRAGAPAQLFLSASEDWMDYLETETARVAPGSRVDLLGNRLVLVAPAGNPAGLRGPRDLAGAAVRGLAIGDPAHVPAGIYAAAWLEAAGLTGAVAGKLRPAKDVRDAIAYVERGEVEAGIVYGSDADGRSGRVDVIAELDAAGLPPIRYPLALILGPDGEAPTAAAATLHAWLRSEEAAVIFRRHGFAVLEAAR